MTRWCDVHQSSEILGMGYCGQAAFQDMADDLEGLPDPKQACHMVWMEMRLRSVGFDLTARRTEAPPRRFKLVRDEDETGISGLGVVAFGVVFSDDVAVTRWNSDVAQTCVWQSMAEVEAVHGHGGRTRIEWIDS